ncbi:MAG: penicillin-binding transpeptidase domain-containing protein [Actinomycetota bacterium]|nr:penicillin-binding transpeptidase domain-containing protein [Actinomycetota bacterium]
MNPDDRRPPITPQLALRVAILGGIALALFAVIFFRLWFLQVLSGDQYLVQARENRTRDVRVQAPRGDIVDRSGQALVTSRRANVVQLAPQQLPEEEIVAAAEWGQAMTKRSKRPKGKKGEPAPIPPIPTVELRERFQRLGRVLNMKPASIQRRAIEQLAVVPYSAVTVRSDVPRSVINYLKERKETFPGVDVDPVYLRSYPGDTLAAQLLGYVGEISPQELKQRRNRDIEQGTIIGKAGLEYTYDRYLRGRDGAKVLRVDANGRFSSDRPVDIRQPIPGRQLQLSLDVRLQKAGQESFQAVAGSLPGAFVAMNPMNGEVYAMGSLPTFDPSVFAKPITQSKFEELTSEENGAPLYNRAIGGLYPSGSTFKPITSLAALDAGVFTPESTINDEGCIDVGNQLKCNAGKVPNGTVDLRRALEVSSDVYYYIAGMELFTLGGERLQKWSKALGLGRKSGLDLPDERAGLIPGREWRDRVNRLERKCRPGNDGVPCYVIEVRPYNLGDNANLAVGQGEVQISPLQMAIAYSTIASGGRVPRPHLGLEIQDSTGAMIQKIEPGPARRVKIDPEHRQAVLDGLARAAQGPNGTSTPVFEGWPHDRLPVYGKTGTAQRNGQVDQSWYVAYVPHKTKPIVIAATVEQGGWGADRAAPITCRMLRSWFSVDAPCQGGGSNTF